MKLVDILTRGNIILNLQGDSQAAVIDELVNKLAQNGLTTDPVGFKKKRFIKESKKFQQQSDME